MDSEALLARIYAQLRSARTGAAPNPHEAPSVPDHELLVRIGGGSYGHVWLARSVTGRFRAVKVVWRQNFSSDRPYEREFAGISQFEPISRSHPGLVNVLHVGRDEKRGCFFYVMELADAAPSCGSPTKPGPPASEGVSELAGCGPAGAIGYPSPAHSDTLSHPMGEGRGEGIVELVDGHGYRPRTLAAELKSRARFSIAEVLQLGVQLADALGHLHRHGLVHRDVKPSNVIFVQGQAKLADIGLVTGADEAHSFVGTEGFIPPEGPGTVQADLFGLSRLLYEAATGKDRLDFPELPPDLDAWPDRERMLELNEILARACAPVPQHRHANAAELAGDLNLLLSGKSIRRAYSIERQLKRATLITSLAVLAALLTTAAVWLQGIQRQRADARAAKEFVLRDRAQRSEKAARERLRESLLQQAVALSASAEPDRRVRALRVLRAAAEVRPGIDLRNAAVAALASPELRLVRSWSPGDAESFGARADSTLARYLRCYNDGSLAVMQVSDDRELLRLPPLRGPADFGFFSRDGSWLAVKYRNADLVAWNLETQAHALIAHGTRRSCFRFLPDSSSLLVGQDDGGILLTDLASGDVRWRSRMNKGIRWLAVHPNEEVAAVASEDKITVQFRSTADGHVIKTVTMSPLGYVGCWTGNARQFITAHEDFSLRIWDWPALETPRLVLRLHRSEPVFLASDPTGRWIASAGWDTRIFWFDVLDGRCLLAQPGDAVAAAVDRPAFLWCRGDNWTVAEFDPAYVPELLPVHDEGKSPERLTFSPNGRWLATIGPDGVRIVDLQTKKISAFPSRYLPKAVVFNTHSDQLYVISERGLTSWRLEVGPEGQRPAWKPLQRTPLPQGLRLALAEFAPSGLSWVGLGKTNRSQGLKWFTAALGCDTLIGYSFVTRGVEFPVISADGCWLAWGNWRARDAFVLDLRTNKPPLIFASEGSTTVAFSPDNRWFVASDSKSARFYKAGSYEFVHSVPRKPAGALPAPMAFSSDSRLCALTVPPDEVDLVDPGSGTRLVTLRTPEHYLVARLAFSPDDQILGVATLNHYVLLWDLGKLRSKLRDLCLDW